MNLVLCRCCDFLFYRKDGYYYDRYGNEAVTQEEELVELDWDTIFFDRMRLNCYKIVFLNGRIVIKNNKSAHPDTVEVVQFP